DQSSDTFIQFFLDLVLEHTLKRDSGISSFIEYFRENEDKLSISSPENRNAVSIMTIHKAKGLEFPIVIFPYADINLYEDRNSHLWVPIDAKTNAGFKEAMLNVNSKMTHFNSTSAEHYEKHLANLELDHMNLLYVALTRPINELYVVCKNDTSKGLPNKKTFAGLFISYLQHLGFWKAQETQYSLGLKTTRNVVTTENTPTPLSLVSYPRKNDQFKIITQSGLLWDSKRAKSIEKGNIIHQLMSFVKTKNDIPFALNELVITGIIQNSESRLFEDLALSIVEHPTLARYFSPVYTIQNETDLIGPNNQIMRPDRLCFQASEAVIIDYKTGLPKDAHQNQIKSYQSMVEDAGYRYKKGYLVYVNDAIEVVEV
ncbi:MAG: 3'-5' exonuclease, partial [Bacteroidota bacterium]